MDDIRCSTCLFWEPPVPEKEVKGQTDVVDRWSECRRNPPQLVKVSQHRDPNDPNAVFFNYQTSRPATRGRDFCGEWRKS